MKQSVSLTLEVAGCEWRYAFIVVQARNDDIIIKNILIVTSTSFSFTTRHQFDIMGMTITTISLAVVIRSHVELISC